MKMKPHYGYTAAFLIGISLINVGAYCINLISRVDSLSKMYTGNIPLQMLEILGRIILSLLWYLTIHIIASKKKINRLSMILIEIWAFIFIVVEAFYYVCIGFYDRALSQFQTYAGKEAYLLFYNDSHGFKYIAMYICIVFGMAMTGIIIERRLPAVVSGILIVAYIWCFGILDMQTIRINSKDMGIVASSILFHLTESVGIFLLGLYLLLVRTGKRDERREEMLN